MCIHIRRFVVAFETEMNIMSDAKHLCAPLVIDAATITFPSLWIRDGQSETCPVLRCQTLRSNVWDVLVTIDLHDLDLSRDNQLLKLPDISVVQSCCDGKCTRCIPVYPLALEERCPPMFCESCPFKRFDQPVMWTMRLLFLRADCS